MTARCCLILVTACGLVSSGCARRAESTPRVLRVCADPNNLPFSNAHLEGFENRLASLIAREMHASVAYTWWAQRRGFFRNTLNARLCDVVLGAPAGLEMASLTQPYYRSTYVFVTRRQGGVHVRSLDDPVLRRVRIGVQLVGDDKSNTPPAHALAARHITRNVSGYTLYGDYSQPNPPAQIVDAVARGDVDVAVVWGPLAGFFAARAPVPLELTPVRPERDGALPFVFDIGIGVRRGDGALKQELNAILDRCRREIDRILDEYHVPRADRSTS